MGACKQILILLHYLIYLVSQLWVNGVEDPGLLNPIQIPLCGLRDHCKLCHNRTTACKGWYNVTEFYFYIIINLFAIQCGGSLKCLSILRAAAHPRRAAPRTTQRVTVPFSAFFFQIRYENNFIIYFLLNLIKFLINFKLILNNLCI